MSTTYDAILLVAFGGPDKPDDVMPFLENVLRGRNVPRQRMMEVAKHYQSFGGKSPINDQCRALIAALRDELDQSGIDLPIYWGNRNWHPMLVDTLRQMRDDGVERALAVFTSGFSSYSSCRQYRENIADAQQQVGDGAPKVDKVRAFFNHPGFIETWVELLRKPLQQLPGAQLLFTAHSIPSSMAAGCDYEAQLLESARLVAEALSCDNWQLVYQSRSGPPQQPWLEPDVCEVLETIDEKSVVLAPIGFISDHMEVIYDLDTEARQVCDKRCIEMNRAATPGTHPRFVATIRELIQERLTSTADRASLGVLGPRSDVCPDDCCPTPVRST